MKIQIFITDIKINEKKTGIGIELNQSIPPDEIGKIIGVIKSGRAIEMELLFLQELPWVTD